MDDMNYKEQADPDSGQRNTKKKYKNQQQNNTYNVNNNQNTFQHI